MLSEDFASSRSSDVNECKQFLSGQTSSTVFLICSVQIHKQCFPVTSARDYICEGIALRGITLQGICRFPISPQQ